jgi:hypothetical protein
MSSHPDENPDENPDQATRLKSEWPDLISIRLMLFERQDIAFNSRSGFELQPNCIRNLRNKQSDLTPPQQESGTTPVPCQARTPPPESLVASKEASSVSPFSSS